MRLRNIIFILTLGLFVFGCNTEGHNGSSKNLIDAKERGTLIGQFKILPTNEEVAEIIDNRIEEAFIEYSWFVTPPKSVVDTAAVNLVLKMSEDNTNFLTDKFRIQGGKIGLFTRHSSQHLWLLLNNSNSDLSNGQVSRADTIKFKLYKGDRELGGIFLIRYRASTQEGI